MAFVGGEILKIEIVLLLVDETYFQSKKVLLKLFWLRLLLFKASQVTWLIRGAGNLTNTKPDTEIGVNDLAFKAFNAMNGLIWNAI